MKSDSFNFLLLKAFSLQRIIDKREFFQKTKFVKKEKYQTSLWIFLFLQTKELQKTQVLRTCINIEIEKLVFFTFFEIFFFVLKKEILRKK